MEPRKTEHLEVPAGLAAEIESAAEEDKRSTSELVREAVEQYLENRRWQRLLAYGEERARTLSGVCFAKNFAGQQTPSLLQMLNWRDLSGQYRRQ